MATVGGSRERLARILSAAFAEGLLSEQTHSHRLGLLFGPYVVDERRLVGDLTLRGARSRPAEGLRRAGAALADAIREMTCRVSTPAPLLLALGGAEKDRLLVGRDSRCDVVVTDPTVSRRHARLTYRDGSWVIQDLASKNGTAVNGTPVTRTALRPGDIVRLGGQALRID